MLEEDSSQNMVKPDIVVDKNQIKINWVNNFFYISSCILVIYIFFCWIIFFDCIF